MELPVKRTKLNKKIVEMIDLYVESQEREALFVTFPTEVNRIKYVESLEEFDKATEKLAPHIDGTHPEFQEIMSLGNQFLNRLRNFTLPNKVKW